MANKNEMRVPGSTTATNITVLVIISDVNKIFCQVQDQDGS